LISLSRMHKVDITYQKVSLVIGHI
jgi:hypothetical protein